MRHPSLASRLRLFVSLGLHLQHVRYYFLERERDVRDRLGVRGALFRFLHKPILAFFLSPFQWTKLNIRTGLRASGRYFAWIALGYIVDGIVFKGMERHLQNKWGLTSAT